MKKTISIDKNGYSGHYFQDFRVETIWDYMSRRNSGTYRTEKLRIGLMCASKEYPQDKDYYVIRELNGVSARIHCPFVYFTLPGSTISWIGEQGLLRENFRFDCSGPRVDELAASLIEDFPDGFVEISAEAPFRAVLEKMRRLSFHRPDEQRFRMPVAAEEFASLFWIVRDSQTLSGRYEKEIRKDAQTISQNPGQRYSSSFFAARLKITVDHYRKLFHQYIGMAPHEFLLDRRLTFGKQLLLSGEHLRLKEIAERCGFTAASEFCRFFRAREGMTPSEFVRNNRD